MPPRHESPTLPTTGWAVWLTVLAAAAMAFLGVLALAGGLAAERLADEWQGAFRGTATVRIPGEADTMEFRTARVLEVLEQTPRIAEARPLGRAERLALLSPWIGDTGAFDELPVPQLIDVTIEPPGPDVPDLQARIERVSPGAVYDDHGAWRRRLAGAAVGLSRLAWAATAIVVLTTALMVALAARASVAAQREVVRVLRVVGAEDRFIVGAFTRRTALRTAAGAFAGTAAALAAFWALPEIGVDQVVKPALGPGIAGWALILVAVPIGAALVSWAVARQAVSRELARLL